MPCRHGADYALRIATLDDAHSIRRLIAASIRTLGAGDYTSEQIEAALLGTFGLDTSLVHERSYYVVVTAHDEIVGCGGWSRRRTVFGGDAATDRDDALLDPRTDPARIRAFFVHPDHARRGLGRRILDHSESEARRAGFIEFELMATLPGKRLYENCGYESRGPVRHSLPDGMHITFVPMFKRPK